jgi:phenylacetate-coenzyme A ligase PaaK-like adenylate-forming protein
MPLIRYRMGDRSRFISGNCPCGTGLKTLESVRGRFAGFVAVGSNVLRLPDFDEALFPIPDLLNFSVTLTGAPGQEALIIEAQMLSAVDVRYEIEQALMTIPAIKNLEITVRCQHNPKEPGSLLKRVILDNRGQYA